MQELYDFLVGLFLTVIIIGGICAIIFGKRPEENNEKPVTLNLPPQKYCGGWPLGERGVFNTKEECIEWAKRSITYRQEVEQECRRQGVLMGISPKYEYEVWKGIKSWPKGKSVSYYVSDRVGMQSWESVFSVGTAIQYFDVWEKVCTIG